MIAARDPQPADTAADLSPDGGPPPMPRDVVHWRGQVTGSWWAVVPGRDGHRLIEAASRDALARAVDRHLTAP